MKISLSQEDKPDCETLENREWRAEMRRISWRIKDRTDCKIVRKEEKESRWYHPSNRECRFSQSTPCRILIENGDDCEFWSACFEVASSCRCFISRHQSALGMEWNVCVSRAAVNHWIWVPDRTIVNKSSIFLFFWCRLKVDSVPKRANGYVSAWLNV
jgi:hypothetical protein